MEIFVVDKHLVHLVHKHLVHLEFRKPWQHATLVDMFQYISGQNVCKPISASEIKAHSNDEGKSPRTEPQCSEKWRKWSKTKLSFNARWSNNFFVSKNVSELPNDLLEVKVSVLFLLLVLAAVFGKESLDWWHFMQMCSNCITMQRSLCQESQLPM